MSRVWKKFLINLAWPVGIFLYAIVITLAIAVAESVYLWAGGVVAVLFIFIPAAVMIVKMMWRDAKQEVEWENWKMLHDIKGKD